MNEFELKDVKGNDNKLYDIIIINKKRLIEFRAITKDENCKREFYKENTIEDFKRSNDEFYKEKYTSLDVVFKTFFIDKKDISISTENNANNSIINVKFNLSFEFKIKLYLKQIGEEIFFLNNNKNEGEELKNLKIRLNELEKELRNRNNKIQNIYFMLILPIIIVFFSFIIHKINDIPQIKTEIKNINQILEEILIQESKKEYEIQKNNKIIVENINNIHQNISEIKNINKLLSENANNIQKNLSEIKITNEILNERLDTIKIDKSQDSDFYALRMKKKNQNSSLKGFERYKNLLDEGLRVLFNKKVIDYTLIFKASRDGYKAEDFHRKCDGKNFTVTIIETTNGRIFGGFTDAQWNNILKSDYIRKVNYKKGNVFLFSWDDYKIYYQKNIYCSHDSGPVFGNYEYSEDYMYKFKEYNSHFPLMINDYCYKYNNYGIKSLANEEPFSVLDYEVYQIKIG